MKHTTNINMNNLIRPTFPFALQNSMDNTGNKLLNVHNLETFNSSVMPGYFPGRGVDTRAFRGRVGPERDWAMQC